MQIYLTCANIKGREREAYLDSETKTMTKAWRLAVLFSLFSLFSGLILCVHALIISVYYLLCTSSCFFLFLLCFLLSTWCVCLSLICWKQWRRWWCWYWSLCFLLALSFCFHSSVSPLSLIFCVGFFSDYFLFVFLLCFRTKKMAIKARWVAGCVCQSPGSVSLRPLPGCLFFLGSCPGSLFFLLLWFLIVSSFIAREYQPFETASRPLLPETAPEEEGEEGDEQLLKTVPFVRCKWPFSIWSLNFWNHAIKSLSKL